MTEQIKGVKRNLARGLYRNTLYLPGFSANNFRALNYHKTSVVKSRDAIGAFFYDLKVEGYIEKIGEVKADHPEAKGRKINLWTWTDHAHRTLKDPYNI